MFFDGVESAKHMPSFGLYAPAKFVFLLDMQPNAFCSLTFLATVLGI